MRDRWAVLVLLAGCVLPVVACTPSDEPGTLPDRTDSVTTPAPTPTPTVTPTPIDPSAALEAEIETFFRAYIDTVNESWTSVDALARRREMFADSCDACLTGYAFAQGVHNGDLSFEGGDAAVDEVTVTSGERAGVVIFMAVVDTPPGRLLDSDGVLVQEFDEAVDRQTVYQATKGDAGRYVLIASESL